MDAGRKAEDYFILSCIGVVRYSYEMTMRGEEAPGFEALIIDIVNDFIIILEERYDEDMDSEQIKDMDRMLEKKFAIRRSDSFF